MGSRSEKHEYKRDGLKVNDSLDNCETLLSEDERDEISQKSSTQFVTNFLRTLNKEAGKKEAQRKGRKCRTTTKATAELGHIARMEDFYTKLSRDI